MEGKVNHKVINPSYMSSGIRDNYSRGTIGEFLKSRVQPGAKLAVVSAYFTIYAYEVLKAELDSIKRQQFLFGEPRFIKSLDLEKTELYGLTKVEIKILEGSVRE